jgi:hypothetical protein
MRHGGEQSLRAEVPALQRPGPEIFDEHVERREPAQQQLLRVVRVQVERDALLVPPERFPIQTDPVLGRAVAANVIAGAGALELDHLRAEVGQHRGGRGRGDHRRRVENPHAGERPAAVRGGTTCAHAVQ